MTSPEAFYVPDGDARVATALTRGPWDPDLQHGGPPAALLGGAIEAFDDAEGAFAVVRMTVELLRPIPIAPVRVEVEPIRQGRRAQQIGARLLLGTTEVARALGLRLRRAPLELPSPVCPPLGPLPAPEDSTPFAFTFFERDVGYQTAVEVRMARGIWGQGPTAAWLRLRYPLVAGAATSPLQSVLTICDAANGVCPALDPRRFAFVNPDLTVYLRRAPVDAWIGLDARSTADPSGVGLAQAVIHDRQGEIGRSAQSLVVASRATLDGDGSDRPTGG